MKKKPMARYPLNLPVQLKQQAEQLAQQQGVSFNQFVLWAVAEKVGALSQSLDDPNFPHVTYRRGTSGQPEPVVRGSGVLVKTVAVAAHHWGMSPEQIAKEYGLSKIQVTIALAFYQAHRAEIDTGSAAEQSAESLTRDENGDKSEEV